MDSVTDRRVRALTPTDMGVESKLPQVASLTSSPILVKPMELSDPLYVKVRTALNMGFAGVILSGPPGTGKSYFAERIAHTISNEPEAIRVVQFHASYQYEDFMQGFSPDDEGHFKLTDKIFPLVCQDAFDHPDITHVILIDEISRCDVARVFGEALTYMEVDKRGREFHLASGDTLIVPQNLVILATMNPWDKGVDELDVALERRFAQIDMPPSSAALRSILSEKGADAAFIDRLVSFFDGVQALDDEMVHLGHAYFSNCVDDMSARHVWDFRLFPFFNKACRLDKEMLSNIKRQWLKAIPPIAPTPVNVVPDAVQPSTQAT